MPHLLIVAVVILLAWLATPLMAAGPAGGANSYWVYIGTSAHPKKSNGIYLCRLDLPEGTLKLVNMASDSLNATFLALHPTGKYLYAVGELSSGPGVIRAFSVDAATGGLKLLNEQSSGGAGPCHVAVDREGRNALAANYSGGSVAVLPIGPDGKLLPATSVIQQRGSSIDPKRQTKAYAHSINLDPDQRFAIVADLGCDKLFIYRFDGDKGTLTPNNPAYANVKPGGGPRHLAYSSDGKFAYVINEMGSAISVFKYDADRGALAEIQMVSTLPKSFKTENTGAEILVHPSGKFLYASNRGEDSIAIFEIDQLTGKLLADGSQSTQGKTPRNFNIDPTGSVLIAANQNSDSLLVMKIDPNTGHLTPGQQLDGIAAPTCVTYLPIAK